MNSENVKEYELVRQEMITVKECITKYLGFVLGGSGVAVYALLAMGQPAKDFNQIAFICFVLSIIMSFVLLILVYKFFSHNRFAGYCKLLNHESYEWADDGKNVAFFAWEICVERLRASDTKPEVLMDLIKNLDLPNVDREKLQYVVEKYAGRNPEKDRYKFIKGLKILFLAISGKIETRSWGFPPIIVAILFFVVFGFLAAGIFTTLNFSGEGNNKVLDENVMVVFAGIVLLGQLFLWWRFIGKLYSLMKGSATVDAFFWRFLCVRVSFLNHYKIGPQYLHLSERLKETFSEFAKKGKNGSGLNPDW